jgi:hypothetical protein
MAFTDPQKVQIRFFLGYPFPFQQLNPRLEGALALVGADATATAIVVAILAKLVTFYGIDPGNPGGPAAIDQAIAQAGVKRVESVDDVVEFGTTGNGQGGASSSAILNTQNDAARQLVSSLSSMFGVEIANDVFGKRGYVNDIWTSRSNQMSVGPRTFLMGS